MTVKSLAARLVPARGVANRMAPPLLVPSASIEELDGPLVVDDPVVGIVGRHPDEGALIERDPIDAALEVEDRVERAVPLFIICRHDSAGRVPSPKVMVQFSEPACRQYG